MLELRCRTITSNNKSQQNRNESNLKANYNQMYLSTKPTKNLTSPPTFANTPKRTHTHTHTQASWECATSDTHGQKPKNRARVAQLTLAMRVQNKKTTTRDT